MNSEIKEQLSKIYGEKIHITDYGILINGDCLEVMPILQSLSVKCNMILCDLPYEISRKSNFKKTSENANVEMKKKYNISIDFGEWDKKELDFEMLIPQYKNLMANDSTMLLFYDIWKMQNVKLIAEKHKLKQPRIGSWEKTNPVPINSKVNYLSNAKEYFCCFTKGKKGVFNSSYDKANYLYPICHGKERTKHTTQKPLRLFEELILKHTNENMLVVDTYIGSGTTGVACINTNRFYIGIELDGTYFEIAKKRIEDCLLKKNIA